MYRFYDSGPMVFEPSNRPLRILHIEDSLADHHLARVALQRGGVACDVQHIDTLPALQRLDATGFDLILADYYLPGFTAMDAWRHVAQQPQHPPFVLLSGAIGEAAAVDAMRLGIADYLLKDDMARLPHVVARAIEVHEARRAREAAAAELAASERRLAELTEHLQRSIEAERAAIAREIHDDIGGALTAVKFDLAWIGRHAQGDGGIASHAQAAVEMLQHAIGASQRIMMNLRPPVLDQGLVAAVRWLAEGFEQRTGIPAQVQASLRETHAAIKVLIVSMYPEDQYALRCLKAGAHGYANKAGDPVELINAVRTLVQGRKYLTPEVAQMLADSLAEPTPELPHEALSERELQTLVKIASGRKLSDIAEELMLSPKTVSVYRARVLDKLKLSNNAELTVYAIRNQLV